MFWKYFVLHLYPVTQRDLRSPIPHFSLCSRSWKAKVSGSGQKELVTSNMDCDQGELSACTPYLLGTGPGVRVKGKDWSTRSRWGRKRPGPHLPPSLALVLQMRLDIPVVSPMQITVLRGVEVVELAHTHLSSYITGLEIPTILLEEKNLSWSKVTLWQLPFLLTAPH